MANQNIDAFDLDDEFDKLFRVVEIEDASNAVICALKPPTAWEALDVAANATYSGVKTPDWLSHSYKHHHTSTSIKEMYT